MSLQLNSADVRLLVDGLKAWINEPMANGVMGMMGEIAITRPENPDEFGEQIRVRKAEQMAIRDGREREARPMLEKLTAVINGLGRLQFSMSQLLMLERALYSYCHAPAQQEQGSVLMRVMLFGKASMPDNFMEDLTRRCEQMTQQTRLRVIPTAYKLVMAINAASEHELAAPAGQ